MREAKRLSHLTEPAVPISSNGLFNIGLADRLYDLAPYKEGKFLACGVDRVSGYGYTAPKTLSRFGCVNLASCANI